MKHTAQEILAIAKAGRPNVRYALNRKQNAIAAYSQEMDRFVCVAGMLIDGSWASMPHELLINGNPVHKREDWIEDKGGA